MLPKVVRSLLLLLLLTITPLVNTTHIRQSPMIKTTIDDARDVPSLFAKTVDQIHTQVQEALEDAQKRITSIITIADELKTYENTIRAYDDLSERSPLAIAYNIFTTMTMVHPDQNLQQACMDGLIKINQFKLSQVTYNKALYSAIKIYSQNHHDDCLQAQNLYFLNQINFDFE